jgi:F0F1-type ATP synthase membrane subunit b/b'
VAHIEALLVVIVEEKVPEAGEYLDAIHTAIQKIHDKITAGVMTSEEAQWILAELEERRERMLAGAQALADYKKGPSAA